MYEITTKNKNKAVTQQNKFVLLSETKYIFLGMGLFEFGLKTFLTDQLKN